MITNNYSTLALYNNTLKPLRRERDDNRVNINTNSSHGDLFIRKNIVSFQKKEDAGLTKPEKDYLKKIKKELKQEGYRYIALEHVDLSKIPNLCKGIKVFEGWTPENLALFAKNLMVISLQSGCPNQCGFCYLSAQPKITVMNWKNYTDLVDGMAEINKRLGFNAFYESSEDGIQFHTDSDPMSLRVYDTVSGDEKVSRTLYDASLYLYEKLGIETSLITAGWDYKSKDLEQAAVNLAMKPELVQGRMAFSIHLTHKFLENSINYHKKSEEAKKQGNLQEAGKLEELAKAKRSLYVERISNNIATLIKNGLPGDKIGLYVYYSNDVSSYSYNNTTGLSEEIMDKVKSKCPEKLEEIRKIHLKNRQIDFTTGRAVNLKNEYQESLEQLQRMITEYNNKYPNEKITKGADAIENGDSDIFNKLGEVDLSYWHKSARLVGKLNKLRSKNSLSEVIRNMKPEEILDNQKGVDVEGNILVNIPGNGVFNHVAKLPYRLNFSEKTEWKGEKPKYIELSNDRIAEVFGKLTN